MKVNTDLDYSTRDYEGFRTDLIKGLQQRIPEYTDTSQTDAGIVILELLAHNLDLLSYYNDKTANEVYLDTAKERSNIIMLAKMLGYVFDDGRPSEFKQVFEIIPQDTDFIIPRGYIVKTTESTVEPEVLFETDHELVIPKGCVGNEKDSEGNYLYLANVVQGYTITGEVVGTSNGTPNQTFYLNHFPVIKDSISLNITEGTGLAEEWTRVDNFLKSSPTDKHFTVTIDASNRGIITFGNGKSGKIPNTHLEGIVATYRVGGGEIGNVSPYSINQAEQKLSGLVQTYNPYSATVLGVDKEEDDVIRLKAKSHFNSTWGAITLNDYKEVAKALIEVLDATSTRGETEFDVIVTVLPKGYTKMTEQELTLLKNKLKLIYEDKKVLGVDVYIKFAEIVNINPIIQVNLYPNVLKKDVNYLVECAIDSAFKGDSRQLHQNLHPSEIISELMQIEGVKYVNCTIPNLPDEVAYNQVVCIENYTLEIVGGI